MWLAQGQAVPAVQARSALVLENLENFHHWDKMSAVLRQWQPENGFAAADWLFGAGNQISNALHQPYLAQYAEIHCLLD